MIFGCLNGCEVNDLIYVQLSPRLYFVVIVSKKVCYFCEDIRKDMNAHLIEWSWLYANTDELLHISQDHASISICSDNRIRKWPSRGIRYQENGKRVVGICYGELDKLAYRYKWILEMLREAEDAGKVCLGRSHVSRLWPGCTESVFNDPDKCDAIIAIGTKQYHVSKKCLSRSPVLHVMLTSENWKDSTLTEVRLTEMKEAMPHMECFLRFMHTGKIDITRQNLMPLILISNKYNTRELDVHCERAMDNILFSGIPIEQVILWWLSTKELNFNSKCKEYLQLNLLSVFSSELFRDLRLDDLVSLLEGNAQVVNSEGQVMRAVISWLKINDRVSDLKYIMPHIKLWAMSIFDIILYENLLLDNGQMEHLYEAMRFHATPVHMRERGTTCRGRYYTTEGLTIPSKEGPLVKYYRKSFPLTGSSADQGKTRKLKARYRTSGSGPREIHILTDQWIDDDYINTIDISVVVYSIENNIRFVKGICQATLSIEEDIGHKLIIKIPKENISAGEIQSDIITVIPRYFVVEDPDNHWSDEYSD